MDVVALLDDFNITAYIKCFKMLMYYYSFSGGEVALSGKKEPTFSFSPGTILCLIATLTLQI
jgi:hypothetical protein